MNANNQLSNTNANYAGGLQMINCAGNLVGSTKNQGQPLYTRRQGNGLVDIRRPVNKGFHLGADKEDEKERKYNEPLDA